MKDLSQTYEEKFQYSEGDRIIKVAVLDTGIRLDHPDFEQPRVKGFGKYGKPIRNFLEPPQRDRIKGVRNFAKKVQQNDNDVTDLNGHGTQVAGLILRFAPMAELYIARVCDGVPKQTTGDFDAGPCEEAIVQASFPLHSPSVPRYGLTLERQLSGQSSRKWISSTCHLVSTRKQRTDLSAL